MSRKKSFVIMIVAGVSMVAVSGAQAPSLQDSIAQYEQKVAKANHDTRELLVDLNILASFYRQAGQLQKALDCLNQALPIEQKANSVLGQAMTFNTMGRVYTDMGQEDKALSYLTQALPLWQAAGQRTGEADALTYIGRVYNNLGQREVALKNLNDAMEIWHDIDNPDTALAAQAAAPSQPSGRIAKRIQAARQKFASESFHHQRQRRWRGGNARWSRQNCTPTKARVSRRSSTSTNRCRSIKRAASAPVRPSC